MDFGLASWLPGYGWQLGRKARTTVTRRGECRLISRTGWITHSGLQISRASLSLWLFTRFAVRPAMALPKMALLLALLLLLDGASAAAHPTAPGGVKALSPCPLT